MSGNGKICGLEGTGAGLKKAVSTPFFALSTRFVARTEYAYASFDPCSASGERA